MALMEKSMFYGASPTIFENAKKLRENQTNAEKILWEYLKQKPYGFNFRRQHPLSTFVADFYCHPMRLIIEVDGGIHEMPAVKQYDKDRQEFLESNGIQFLRFTNDEVETNLSSVASRIEAFVQKFIKTRRYVTPPFRAGVNQNE
jgi:cyclase